MQSKNNLKIAVINSQIKQQTKIYREFITAVIFVVKHVIYL